MQPHLSRRAALAGALAVPATAALPPAANPAPKLATATPSLIADLAAHYLAADRVCRNLRESAMWCDVDCDDIPGYRQAETARQEALEGISTSPAASLGDVKSKAAVLLKELGRAGDAGRDLVGEHHGPIVSQERRRPAITCKPRPLRPDDPVPNQRIRAALTANEIVAAQVVVPYASATKRLASTICQDLLMILPST